MAKHSRFLVLLGGVCCISLIILALNKSKVGRKSNSQMQDHAPKIQEDKTSHERHPAEGEKYLNREEVRAFIGPAGSNPSSSLSSWFKP